MQLDNIKPKSFINFQTFQTATKSLVETGVKKDVASYEDKTKANELLQGYYVKNAGNVLINPRLSADEKIFTPDEIKTIKNLTGTIAQKVDRIKAMYLEKRGYDKDLINIEIKDKKFSSHGEAGTFDSASGKVILFIDQNKGKTNEELVSIVYHELRHFEQYARMCKIVGLETTALEHDRQIHEIEQDLKTSIKESEDELAKMGDNPTFAEVKKQRQELYASQKELLESIPSRLLNKSFWQKAIAQTRTSENFSKDLTLNNWINPQSCPRLEEYDDGILYEDVEYYTNPFEVDAYQFESKVQQELGIPYEDTKQLIEINKKLKETLMVLYDKKTSKK